MANPRLCSVGDCGKPLQARGYCSSHYGRLITRCPEVPKRDHRPNGTALQWIRNHIGHIGSDCLNWPFLGDCRGYGQVRYEGEVSKAHIVMCTLVHGPRPSSDHQAAHSCGKGSEGCVHPGHLRWATKSENEADKVGHGTSNRGERHGRSKLTQATVESIRRASGTASKTEIAKLHGISRSHVSEIIARKTWAWLA